jgi:magnesium-transporting ATPase (P-type)
MDILAAIALGTGREQNKNPERISRKFRVFQPQMWRQIFAQGTFQMLVLVILVFFGPMMFGYDYNLITTDARNKEKIKMDTFIFLTFFSMTMFNQICCRVV